MFHLKRYFRSAQTLVPWLHNARFAFERRCRRVLRVPHESDWRAFRKLNIGSGVILDVGANRGLSIESFRIVLPRRRIIAFEPNQDLARMLRAAYRNCHEVRIEAEGLSDASGETSLFIPQYRGWVFDGLATVCADSVFEFLNEETVVGFDPRYLSWIEVRVGIQRLDDLQIGTIAVLKLDTQGSDESILRGGLRAIGESLPIILAEHVGTEVVALLAQFGYRPYVYRGSRLIADRIDATNKFFLQPSHVVEKRADHNEAPLMGTPPRTQS